MVKIFRGHSPEETVRRSIRGFGSALVFFFALISLISFCSTAFAENGTTAGAVTARTNGDTQIIVTIPYTEDTDANNTVRVQWKLCSDADYAAPPTNTTDASHASSPYVVTISGLTANTCYQIKTTYNDSAVSGSNPQTIKIATTWDNTLLHNSNRFLNTTKWNGGSGTGNWGTGTMANSGTTAPSKYGQITCETCHIADAPNIKRIRSSIASPNGTDSFPGQTGGSTINFQSVTTPNGFADDTGGHATSQKICEYCHTLNKYHNYNTANNTGGFLHNNNTDCTGCHPHSLGFLYNASCDSCHGNPPTMVSIGAPNGLASPATQALGPSPTDPGAHNAHAVARAMTCEACHTGYSMPGNTIQLNFQVGSGTFPGWGSNSVSTATYNAPQSSLLLNSYSFVGSGNTTVVTSGTYTNQCSNLYCHGGGDTGAGKAALTGGSNQSPAWTDGASQAACGTCHGASDTNPPTMGAHQRHATTGTYAGSKQGLGLGCTKCHSTTTDMTHINGKVAWGLDRADTKFGTSAVYNNAESGELDNLAPSSTYQSCNNIYCHSSVQNNGGTAAGTYVSQAWQSGAVNCDSCHGQALHSNGQPSTGSHDPHVTAQSLTCSVCHNGAGAETASHANQLIDMSIDATYGGSYTQSSHAPQSGGYGSCSSVLCHGSGSPTWGASTTNNICTKCHGTGSVTVTAANRYVVAPPNNTAGSSGTATDTGQVSNDAKVGAHQTHLRMLNGLSSFGTVDSRCQACHGTLPTSGSHASGSSEPAFEGLATKSGTMSPSYSSGSCNNTYCHNPAATGGTLASANAGTGTAPLWTNANYVADGTLKTTANCGVCHKSPWDAGFTSTFTHGVMTTSTDCSGCHGHNGGTGGSPGQQHMDGIKYGGGSCNTCHGYEASSWAAATQRAVEGKGAHAKHIAHLVTLWGGTLSHTTDQFGSGASWTNVCGVCHNGATHNMSEAIGGTGRTISILNTYQFGTNAPSYSGVVGTSSSVNLKSCSSVSCHFTTTPVWSAY